MNFETGSVRNNFPSSYSIITATLVIGLVIEAMRNIVLVRIGVLLSLSWKPVAWMSTISPVAHDQRDDAGGFVAIDEAFHPVVQSLQPLRGDANRGRRQ